MTYRILLGLLVAVALAGSASARPNIVVIYTDDQRADTLAAMPVVQRELVAKGVVFTSAIATNPLCCPARAALLTGRYSHSTGVWSNILPYGGWQAFVHRERSTFATWLQRAGYRTAFFGKYLNGYGNLYPYYVPPGWNRWVAFAPANGSNYYDYTLNVDGRLSRRGSARTDYSTDVLAGAAAQFIRKSRAPFLLVLAPFAPHAPYTPAARHLNAPVTWAPGPAYDEADVSDKPAWVRALRRRGAEKTAQNQLRALLSVDQAVGRIIRALEATGRLRNTVLVFTSDNGYSWADHRWVGKQAPYEESVRVPLVIRSDRLAAHGERGQVVGNIDLAPTIAALAGARRPRTDGISLVPLLRADTAPWRTALALEAMQSRVTVVPSYCGVRRPALSYVQYATGEEELYDLQADPHQLVSVARDPTRRRAISNLRTLARRLCASPAPLPTGWRLLSPCLVRGTPAGEIVRGTPWFDRICAGGAADRVLARDGVQDFVVCGAGNDTAVVDAMDNVLLCEVVQRQ